MKAILALALTLCVAGIAIAAEAPPEAPAPPPEQPAPPEAPPVAEPEPAPEVPLPPEAPPAPPAPPQMQPLPPEMLAVAASNAAFAIDLYRCIIPPEGNLFFSPFVISTALTMACDGARGQTAAQMAQTLRLDVEDVALHRGFAELLTAVSAGAQAGSYELGVVNALWVQSGRRFRGEYSTLLSQYYGSSVYEVDFARTMEEARRSINDQIWQGTGGKIENLILPATLPPATRLLLTNGVRFRGNWAKPFDPNLTQDAPFHLVPGRDVGMPMMRRAARFGYMEAATFRAVDLPYAGSEVSMVIFLPRQMEGLREFDRSLTIPALAGWLALLRQRSVDVALPRLWLTTKMNLGPTLVRMGMVNAFSDVADLSGMDGTNVLYLNGFFHQARIDITEQGIETADAVPAPEGGPVTVIEQPVPFVVDHPFFFLVRHVRSGSILFIGRVRNPWMERPLL